MFKRWSIPIATVVVAFGSLLGMANANASTAATHHPSTTHAPPGGAAVKGVHPGGQMLRPTGGAKVRGETSRASAESTNWSGYAVTGANGAYKSVSAAWTEPSATCTSSGRRSTDSYAAFWVGLDGYSSESVEQTGSDSDCDGKTPDYYGWYEM